MTVSPLAGVAELVLDAYPPGCPLRVEAEHVAIELLAADPDDTDRYARRRRAARVLLAAALAGCEADWPGAVTR